MLPRATPNSLLKKGDPTGITEDATSADVTEIRVAAYAAIFIEDVRYSGYPISSSRCRMAP
ncbi:hypothetical protein Poly51_32200 [Rubripirellula tenax]|uniref:Uncharacterized protein n=1 Tax=Rubripirellula tenax TaxID=2528015 RepID=A0A5C6F4W5_9BACT|nr:hypothetical protein Poly51_32200 [Rubripirellula tenax]